MGRCHGGARDEPAVREKVSVAVDKALVEAVDGAPLGKHLPAVALEVRAAD